MWSSKSSQKPSYSQKETKMLSKISNKLNSMRNGWGEFKTDPLRMGVSAIMFYLAFQIFADILSIKVTQVAGLTFGAVFFVYPLTFTFRDLIQKFLGKKVARTVIVTALAINLLMVLIFQIYVMMKPAPGNEFVQDAVSLIFGSTWRIILASIVAEFISEMVDTNVYSKWVNKFGQKHQWGRVLFSNIVAGPLDVIIFNLIAFSGLWPWDLIVAVTKTEFVIRIAMAVVSIPLIYIAPSPNVEKIKKLLGVNYEE